MHFLCFLYNTLQPCVPNNIFSSIKMFAETSFWGGCNTNLYIFIITMILSNATNERWNNIGWVSFVIEIFNFNLVCSNLVMLIKLLTLYSSEINLS